MDDSVPAVLSQLALAGVTVQWRDGKAVFKAVAAPSAGVIALIDARKADISAFLHPDAVRRRLDAEAEVLRAPRPPDVSDDRWETALDGLRAFVVAGYGDEAQRLGWPRDELYRVPQLWSQIHVCGCALVIGDNEVVEVTPTRIGIKTRSGAIQSFYRKPQVDYALVHETRLKLIRGSFADGSEEPKLRSFEFAINFYRSNNGCDLETAKRVVLDLLKPAGRP
jgi:hypothetical protein